MEKRYLVFESDGHDEWCEVFMTAEEANDHAEGIWNHLTREERPRRHVYAAVVTEADLEDYAKDEDTGKIDWRLYTGCNDFPGAFDSSRLIPEKDQHVDRGFRDRNWGEV